MAFNNYAEVTNSDNIAVTDRTSTGPAPDGSTPSGSSDWGSITGTPTSAAGYGIVNGSELDAFAALGATGLVTRTAANTYAARTLTAGDNVSITNGSGVSGNPTIAVPSMPWADVTGTPTTLAGYGITDAQPLDADLTAIAALTTTSYGRDFLTLADASAARTYIGAGTSSFSGAFGDLTGIPTTLAGYGITDAQPLDSDLTTIAGLSPANNDVMQRKSGAWTNRTLAQYWADLMADPTVSATAYTGLPFSITNDKRLIGRDAALPPFVAQEIAIGTSLDLASATLNTIQDIRTTATPTFTGVIADMFMAQRAGPQFVLYDTTSTANNRRFDWLVNSNTLTGRLVNDADSAASNWMTLTRSGNAVTQLSFHSINDTPIGNVTRSTAGFTTVNTTGVCALAQVPAGAGIVSAGDNNTGFGAFRAFGGSAQIGFQIGSNVTVADTLEFTPATVAGGTTFTTPVATLNASGLFTAGSLRTAAPSGGTAQPWKLGSIVTAASALDVTRYVEAEINGVACKLALIT
jgi:hypothetical protein